MGHWMSGLGNKRAFSIQNHDKILSNDDTNNSSFDES